MKRRYLLGVLAAAVMLAGCAQGSSDNTQTKPETSSAEVAESASEAETQTEAAKKDQKYKLTEENFKLIGRTTIANDTLWLTYSGTGAEFTVTGKAASVVLYGDSTAAVANNDTNYARYAIYVDGERVVDDVMNEGAKNVTIFEGDEERTAVVSIIKLSETQQSMMGIKQVNVTAGEVKKTEDKDLYIEFIGDSITCGYGVDDEDKSHSFKTATEDATKAYAYKTAKLLDADFSLVSISGYGIISGYSGDGKIHDKQRIPDYYDTLGYSYGACGYFKPQDTKWDFKRQPDAVVINLGTNDDSYCKNDEEKQNAYKDGYVAFLKSVREKNPDAQILCTLGLMGDNLYKKVEEAVKEYTEETGDTKVTTLHLDPIKPDEGYAADWHPTEKTHTRAAETVAEALQKLLN